MQLPFLALSPINNCIYVLQLHQYVNLYKYYKFLNRIDEIYWAFRWKSTHIFLLKSSFHSSCKNSIVFFIIINCYNLIWVVRTKWTKCDLPFVFCSLIYVVHLLLLLFYFTLQRWDHRWYQTRDRSKTHQYLYRWNSTGHLINIVYWLELLIYL